MYLPHARQTSKRTVSGILPNAYIIWTLNAPTCSRSHGIKNGGMRKLIIGWGIWRTYPGTNQKPKPWLCSFVWKVKKLISAFSKLVCKSVCKSSTTPYDSYLLSLLARRANMSLLYMDPSNPPLMLTVGSYINHNEIRSSALSQFDGTIIDRLRWFSTPR